MLKRLGNPEEGLSIVHVAGTNGKGSTSAMIEGILRAAGYTTGLFTSPFLDSFTNRIKVNGQDISQEDLVSLVAELKPVAEEEALTQFEFITILGIAHFAAKGVDAVVLEVGLGGRFDATNAVTRPVLTVITNIGYDHMEILGDTLAKIAFEKAGILKPHIPLVTAVEDEESWGVIEARSRELGVPVRRLLRDFSYTPECSALDGQIFSFRGDVASYEGLKISLLGGHQLKNAATAVEAALWLGEMGFDIDEAVIRKGLGAARWPGRFEIMGQDPLLIMDGAHNAHGLGALRTTLDDLLPGRPIHWVLGLMEDKDMESMLKLMQGRDIRVYACAPDIPRAKDAFSLAAAARIVGYGAAPYESVREALKAAVSDARNDEVVVVAGSLYLVSEARQAMS
jgi:dihydrofolate synthase/folylpolyglutamate synthase